jgi:CDP-glucose 4,6-dehydratase
MRWIRRRGRDSLKQPVYPPVLRRTIALIYGTLKHLQRQCEGPLRGSFSILRPSPSSGKATGIPRGTFATNVMGTVNLLEAIRRTPSVESVIIITTDKVYRNQEWEFPYREIDPLGGYDPYSASKAAVEIATASYRSSFFPGNGGSSTRVATARAGNVIGGGDWAKDRLVPDCLRAFEHGEPVRLRFPRSVRPWQHVLDALFGYLLLGTVMSAVDGAISPAAWNFGPDPSGDASVGDVATSLASSWGEGASVVFEKEHEAMPHEAGLLRLDSSRARQILGWRPRWNLGESLQRTVDWHRAWGSGEEMRTFSLSQVAAYRSVPGS